MKELLHTVKIGPALWVLTKNFEGIPAGFVTDFASVPRPCRNILAPASGPHAEEAVPHDWNYSLDSGLWISRKDSDLIFIKGMIRRGTVKWRASAGYAGVRVAGWKSFKKMHSIDKVKKQAYPWVDTKFVLNLRSTLYPLCLTES